MKTNKFFYIVMLFVLLVGTAVSFSSCSSDDDGFVSTTIADYYVEFSVYDRGTLSAAEASQMAADLNTIGIEWNGYTLEEAKYAFDKLMNSLVDNDAYAFDATFMASLKADGRTVYTKKISFSKNGCRVK